MSFHKRGENLWLNDSPTSFTTLHLHAGIDILHEARAFSIFENNRVSSYPGGKFPPRTFAGCLCALTLESSAV